MNAWTGDVRYRFDTDGPVGGGGIITYVGRAVGEPVSLEARWWMVFGDRVT